MAVKREVVVDAPPEEVWEALASEEGRERWLGESDRDVRIEEAEPPHRLVWWWSSEERPPTRVEFRTVALPRGTRIVVVESAPGFPLALFASSLAAVPA